MDTYAFKYTVANARGMGFNKKLTDVREPGGVWRPVSDGATYLGITNWLIAQGYRFGSRSKYNGTHTEVWEPEEKWLPDEAYASMCEAHDDAYANRDEYLSL